MPPWQHPDYLVHLQPYPDAAVELLHHGPVYEEGVDVVGDKGPGLHLHLALFQQQLHLQVTCEPHAVFLQPTSHAGDLRELSNANVPNLIFCTVL